MTHRKKSLNNKIMQEEELSESDDYLISVLGVINGYCKVNLVVPQTSTFYSSQSLLPINANVNDIIFNNKIQKSKINNSPDIIADMLKNVNFKTDNTIDDKSLSDKTSINDFQIYSKPSYSNNINNLGKKENTKRSISPKSRKKKNKYSKVDTASSSTSDIHTHSALSDISDQSSPTDYHNQYDSKRSDEGLHCIQDQELTNKQLRTVKNSINNIPLRNRLSLSESNSENEIQNDKLSPQSQCPLCFGLYPTPDIEAHASECNI